MRAATSPFDILIMNAGLLRRVLHRRLHRADPEHRPGLRARARHLHLRRLGLLGPGGEAHRRRDRLAPQRADQPVPADPPLPARPLRGARARGSEDLGRALRQRQGPAQSAADLRHLAAWPARRLRRHLRRPALHLEPRRRHPRRPEGAATSPSRSTRPGRAPAWRPISASPRTSGHPSTAGQTQTNVIQNMATGRAGHIQGVPAPAALRRPEPVGRGRQGRLRDGAARPRASSRRRRSGTGSAGSRRTSPTTARRPRSPSSPGSRPTRRSAPTPRRARRRCSRAVLTSDLAEAGEVPLHAGARRRRSSTRG